MNQSKVSVEYNPRTNWETLSKVRYRRLKIFSPLSFITGFQLPFNKFDENFVCNNFVCNLVLYIYLQINLPYCARSTRIEWETYDHIDVSLQLDTSIYDFLTAFESLTKTSQCYSMPYIRGNYYGFEDSNYFFKYNVDSYQAVSKLPQCR